MPGQDYYNDDDAQAPESQPQEDSSMADDQTTIIPRSLFGQDDVKPGDTINLKVEKVDQDEVVVSKAEQDEDQQPEEPQHMNDEGPQAPPGSMGSMMDD